MENSNFDILDYLNNIYMHKMGNEIDVLKAGGHYNIHSNDDENKTQEEMLEINKKHIDIPNAQIKFFSHRQGDIEQHNETKDDTNPIDESNTRRKRRDEVSTEREQQEHSGGVLSEQQEIIEI